MKKTGISKVVAECRLAARLTQAELAERSDINRGALAKIEGGFTPNPGYAILEKLTKALGPRFAKSVCADLTRHWDASEES